MSKKKSKEFLVEYLNSSSPTGHEYTNGGQQVWIDYIKPFVKEVHVDPFGTAYAVTGNLDSEYSVVIEAHVDEIAWLVNYIDDKGYIRVIRNGGSDHQIAPSMRVNVWGTKGPVNGIFGHPAIHLRDRKDEIGMNDIFIDVGATSKEEVLKMGIEIGTVITFQDEFMELGKKFYTGRAIDNRIGGYTIAEVARMLHKNSATELPYKLYIVNSVQEEIGLRGAEMIADRLKPNVAITCDVTHETTSPVYSPAKQGLIEAGKGLAFQVGTPIHNTLLKHARTVADNQKIPYQLNAGVGIGNDAAAFAYSNSGIPTVHIGFPLKYMHTTVETVHKDDVTSAINLMYQLLLSIQEGQEFNYHT